MHQPPPWQISQAKDAPVANHSVAAHDGADGGPHGTFSARHSLKLPAVLSPDKKHCLTFFKPFVNPSRSGLEEDWKMTWTCCCRHNIHKYKNIFFLHLNVSSASC